jgi:hypothetical protein
MTNDFPATLKELQEELLVHAKDGRGGVGDAGFRLAIAIDNLGSFTRHYTHDQNENPVARPHGTPDSKVSDAGHAIVQILTFIAVCDVDIQEAVNSALSNLREKDFMKRTSSGTNLCGTSVFPGEIQKLVWKPDSHFSVMPGDPQNYIAVISHPASDARLAKFAGIITDHGGMHCHAAIIAREFKIPCIVGTGSATERLFTFDIVKMQYDGRIVKVEDSESVVTRNTK